MERYVPLSQRSPDEIRAQAELYQEMAASARTPEAKRGLEKLMVRLIALAEQRRQAKPRVWHQTSAQELSSAAD
jgi:hypothetical protein